MGSAVHILYDLEKTIKKTIEISLMECIHHQPKWMEAQDTQGTLIRSVKDRLVVEEVVDNQQKNMKK